MTRLHYHKCVHIENFTAWRKAGKMFITLCVAGGKQLILLCPECHILLSKWREVDIIFYTKKRVDRKVKRYFNDYSPVFFELTVI